MKGADPEAIRALAQRHRERGSPSAAAMLDLAAALTEAAGPPPTSPWFLKFRGASSAGDQLADALGAWAAASAEVLAAMARSLSGTQESWTGGGVSSSADSLPALTERLVATTRSTNESLSRAAGALRGEGAELVRRAGEVGALERSLQQERGRLRETLERCTGLEAQLANLGGERAKNAERVSQLQERLRIAGAATTERRAMEARVAEAEKVAAQERAKHEELSARQLALEQELSSLGERLARTRALVRELEGSPHLDVSRRVLEIWRSLPPDSAGGPPHG